MGKIKRRGGLYPNKSYLEGYAKKLWIALEPTACCYVSVDSTGIETTYYLDVAYRKINDVDEPNDIQSWDEQQLKVPDFLDKRTLFEQTELFPLCEVSFEML